MRPRHAQARRRMRPLAWPCRWARLGQWAASRDNASLSREPVRTHWLRPHLCMEQCAARHPSGHIRAHSFALARAAAQKPCCQSSRCNIWSVEVLRDSASSAVNSLRFSRSRAKMRPTRLLPVADSIARRARTERRPSRRERRAAPRSAGRATPAHLHGKGQSTGPDRPDPVTM